MKIEFKKVPQTPSEFKAEFNSVKLEGKFCRISPTLIEIKSKLSGSLNIECSRCGKQESINIDEMVELLLSDGILKNDSENIVIEIENSIIDFDEIINSEIASIQSDYYLCEECSNDNKLFEQEF